MDTFHRASRSCTDSVKWDHSRKNDLLFYGIVRMIHLKTIDDRLQDQAIALHDDLKRDAAQLRQIILTPITPE
jgi:hypothetical protein